MALFGLFGGRSSGTGSRFEPKLTEEQRADVVELHAGGATPGEIAREMGVSLRTIQRVLKAARASDDPSTTMKQQLETAKARIQLDALQSNPDVQARFVEQLVGEPRDKPLDEATLARAKAFFENQGNLMIHSSVKESLERRISELEERNDRLLERNKELADKLAGVDTDASRLPFLERWGIAPEAQQALAPYFGSFFVWLLTQRNAAAAQPSATPNSVPAVVAAADSPSPALPAAAAPNIADQVLVNMLKLEPTQAAQLLYDTALLGVQVGGLALADAVRMVLVIPDAFQLATLLESVPGVELLVAAARERPAWVNQLLHALRAIHAQRTAETATVTVPAPPPEPPVTAAPAPVPPATNGSASVTRKRTGRPGTAQVVDPPAPAADESQPFEPLVEPGNPLPPQLDVGM